MLYWFFYFIFWFHNQYEHNFVLKLAFIDKEGAEIDLITNSLPPTELLS